MASISFTELPGDHLTALPPELLHMIISYLFVNHIPDIAFLEVACGESATTKRPHPFDFLAATCRSLRGHVMEWSRRFLSEHSNITKYKQLKTDRLQLKRNFLRGHSGLLTWVDKHCVFCGKRYARSPTLSNSFRCCGSCDMEHWPDQIDMTDALKEYDLERHHLFRHQLPVKLLHQYPGLPKLRYGTYKGSDIIYTTFLRHEVRELASLLHGDLRAHLAQREAKREDARMRERSQDAQEEAEAVRSEVQADAPQYSGKRSDTSVLPLPADNGQHVE